MIEGKRVVCMTPAGRRRYMRLLVPMVLSSPLVDEYQVWINTDDPDDTAFLRGLDGLNKVRLIEHPTGTIEGNASIRDFFIHATDPDAVYIRLDDDIVWMEENTIETIARERMADNDAFLLAPTIINNAICTNILQNRGIVDIRPYVRSYVLDKNGWADAGFAEKLHLNFIDTFIEGGDRDRYRFDQQTIGCTRFSINCISWHGADMAPIAGSIERDDEEFLSCVHPARNGLHNKITGATCVAHFAFYTQREKLDTSGLLERYAAIFSAMEWVDGDITGYIEALRHRLEKRARTRSAGPGDTTARSEETGHTGKLNGFDRAFPSMRFARETAAVFLQRLQGKFMRLCTRGKL